MKSIDLFAGGGGASLGIEWATGSSPIAAVNHDEGAIAMHSANHPETDHFQEDVFEVSPYEAAGLNDIDLLWASPDCFPAGTLILTKTGYRRIETLAVGDEVLTHKNRWRKVVTLMRSHKPLTTVKIQGHCGLTSSSGHSHFAAIEKGGSIQKIEASKITRGMYLATPRAIPECAPTPNCFNFSAWELGRFVADGWAGDQKGIVITVGAAKLSAFRSQTTRSKRKWKERRTRTAHQFTTYGTKASCWLKQQFGHLAHNKRLPGWVFAAPRRFRLDFLQGYLDGDGYRAEAAGDLRESSTVSRELAIGLATLGRLCGYTVSTSIGDLPNEIQGRQINSQSQSYIVKFRGSVCPKHRQQWDSDDHTFYPVRGADSSGFGEVFNITVDEDHTYVVEGFVTNNCTHFSRAKGGKPKSKKIRGLAWVVVDWAIAIRPRLICLENVAEFQTWGPLHEDGTPDKSRAGETFREFIGKLEHLGYQVDWRVLNAADYGSPTLRKRLFLVARNDGAAVNWPDPTHGPDREFPYRTAAECIDWSIPCPSIFTRKRPLADATLRRIAHGIVRYVLKDKNPFIVNLTHGGRLEPVDDPFRTITGANRGEKAVVAPYFIPRHGERPGQEPRARRVDRPMPTITATANGATLVAAFMAKHYGGVIGHDLKRPLGTVTAKDHHSIVAAHLTKFYGTSTGASLNGPTPTITGQGQHIGLVSAFLAAYYGSEKDGQKLNDPMRTITSKNRFGLVTVEIEGVTHVITDIGMRMLSPRELARAQGFPDDYQLVGTKTAQIARIGNSVCPQVVEAIVNANKNPLHSEG